MNAVLDGDELEALRGHLLERDAEIARLKRRLDESLPRRLGLSRGDEAILLAVFKAAPNVLPWPRIADFISRRTGRPAPSDESLRVRISRLRRQVEGWGITIQISRGAGYYLGPQSTARLRQLIAEDRDER